MRLILIPLCWFALSASAAAGSWPRGGGETFLSIGHSYSTTYQSNYTSIYGEWGLSPSVTVGIEGGGETGRGDLAIFLRQSTVAKTGVVIAGEFGFGYSNIKENAFLKPGIGLGYGVSLGAWTGWMDAHATAQLDPSATLQIAKLDVTLGIEPNPGRKIMFDLNLQHRPGTPAAAAVSPSVALRIGKRTFAHIGASQGIWNSQETKVKIGTWLQH